MKHLISILALLLAFSAAATQSDPVTGQSEPYPFDETLPPEDETAEEVFDVVEQMPQFPGGTKSLTRYISTHIRYPAAAAEKCIQGRVIVRFVITATGSIDTVKVVRGVDPDLDKEAIRVIKALPKFIPGKNNGKAVNCRYVFPVDFRLKNLR